MFYKSVLGILRRDANPYLKLTELRNFFCIKKRKEFLVFVEAHFNILWCLMVLNSWRGWVLKLLWQISERYLLHCFTSFIKCNIKSSKSMRNIVKDFNFSSHPCHSPGEIPPGGCLGTPWPWKYPPSKTLGEILKVNKSWLHSFVPTQHGLPPCLR